MGEMRGCQEVKIAVTDSSLKFRNGDGTFFFLFLSRDYREARVAFRTRRDKSESSFLERFHTTGDSFRSGA